MKTANIQISKPDEGHQRLCEAWNNKKGRRTADGCKNKIEKRPQAQHLELYDSATSGMGRGGSLSPLNNHALARFGHWVHEVRLIGIRRPRVIQSEALVDARNSNLPSNGQRFVKSARIKNRRLIITTLYGSFEMAPCDAAVRIGLRISPWLGACSLQP